MKYHQRAHVSQVFNDLHESGVPWLLLRNTNDELPERLPIHKDIDVLTRFGSHESLQRALKERGYRKVRHPFSNDVRLYGVHEFEKYRSPLGVLLDVSFEIAVRSLDDRQWIPLDQGIQESAWANRSIGRLGELEVPMLGQEDMFACTVARCVFDRHEFPEWHCRQLIELWATCDTEQVAARLRAVFFNYTDRLLELIRAGRFADIVKSYIEFSEY